MAPPIEWPVDPVEKAEAWFRARGWEAHDFQREVWRAQLDGESGLLVVPTGSGKTYAATLAALCAGLRVIYLSPLRAMARDLQKALARPVDELGLGLRVETRTSDTGAHIRSRQRERLPDVLITTPARGRLCGGGTERGTGPTYRRRAAPSRKSWTMASARASEGASKPRLRSTSMVVRMAPMSAQVAT